jgi:hypothetical protein
MRADEVSITVDRRKMPSLPKGFDRFYHINQDDKRPSTFKLGTFSIVQFESEMTVLNAASVRSLLENYAKMGILDRAFTLHDGQEIVKLGTNTFMRVFGNRKVLLLGSCLYFNKETSPRVPCLGVDGDGCTLTITYPLFVEIVFSQKFNFACFSETASG